MIEEIIKEVQNKSFIPDSYCEEHISLEDLFEILDKYNNQPDYKSDIELFNLANKTLKDENENLNKGIDELIKQCENEILEYEEFFKPNSKIHQLIFSEDEYYATINFRNKLKKLKGE